MHSLNGSDVKTNGKEIPHKEKGHSATEKTGGAKVTYHAILIFMFVTMLIGTLWVFNWVWLKFLKVPMCAV